MAYPPSLYQHDGLNRLIAAQVKGIFHEETGGQPGYISGDLLGKKSLDTTLEPDTMVGLDYGSSSIGLDFGRQVAAVGTIHLKKDQPGSTYRVNKKALEILYSNDNITFTRVADGTWKFADDGKGNYTLTLAQPIDAQVVKVHNKYDDRDEDLGFTDQAQFKNTLDKAISAEQKLDEATLGYVYDGAGNRIEERFTRATTQTTLYTYYLNSNRLLSNGKYAFVYDANGSLIKKGNAFTIGAGQEVTFATSGEGVEYWEYGYDLRNQLVQVTKNGQVVGSYVYDGEGLRVAGTSAGISRHYIFDPGGRVIYETRVDGGSGGSSTNPATPPDTSYVFSFGQHLAKVEGAIGGNGEVSYYHNDHLGSPMAMTDKTGKVIWSQDYLPYGEDLNENPQGGDTRFKFTGKEQDEATGLYYFNARWYDPDLGRFVTEDSYAGDPNDPQTLNLYTYVLGNPLKYTDPTGNVNVMADAGPIGEPDEDAVQKILKETSKKGSGQGNKKSEKGENDSDKNNNRPNVAKAFGLGMLEAAKASYEGIVSAVRDPAAVAQALEFMAKHPDITAKMMLEELSKVATEFKEGDSATRAKILGRVAGEVALGIVGGKGIDKVAKLTKGAQATVKAAELGDLAKVAEVAAKSETLGKAYHYTAAENVESIIKKGLFGGKQGVIYTTPKGDLSPLQAQIDLALRPNRPLPEAIFEVDLDALRGAGIEFSDPRLVARSFNMPGGGEEILIYAQRIPSEFLRRVK